VVILDLAKVLSVDELSTLGGIAEVEAAQ
jgi:hypothetical protein